MTWWTCLSILFLLLSQSECLPASRGSHGNLGQNSSLHKDWISTEYSLVHSHIFPTGSISSRSSNPNIFTNVTGSLRAHLQPFGVFSFKRIWSLQVDTEQNAGAHKFCFLRVCAIGHGSSLRYKVECVRDGQSHSGGCQANAALNANVSPDLFLVAMETDPKGRAPEPSRNATITIRHVASQRFLNAPKVFTSNSDPLSLEAEPTVWEASNEEVGAWDKFILRGPVLSGDEEGRKLQRTYKCRSPAGGSVKICKVRLPRYVRRPEFWRFEDVSFPLFIGNEQQHSVH